MTTSDSESRSAIVLELAEEFLDRYRNGERPPLKEYIDKHPNLAAEIREVFPAMAMMEKIALADESLAGATTGDTPAPRVPDLTQLGDFRILREVGRGGMGVVYEAEQVSLGRHVALKVLPSHLLGAARQKHRFEREAKAAARLHHTNIVPVFGVGEHDGTPYYVMQFIHGLGLDGVLDELKRMRQGPPEAAETITDPAAQASRRDLSAVDVARSLMTGRFPGAPLGREDEVTPLPLRNGDAATAALTSTSPSAALSSPWKTYASDSSFAHSSSVSLLSQGTSGDGRGKRGKRSTYWEGIARIGAQVADALEYAHKQGILHRDVKPSNLLLDTRGTVWVADFGLAKASDQQDLTHTGDILGTLRYMPPEAFEGKSEARGDVYSLGLTLYELLAFRPAFGESDRARLVRQVTNEPAERLRKVNPEVPRDLETIVQKAIERDPAHRYATAGAMAADLQRFLDDEPIQARRTSTAERFLRWGRRNPGIAVLGATLTGVLIVATAASLVVAGKMSRLADRRELAAKGERAARLVAEKAQEQEAGLRKVAERARAEADLQRRQADEARTKAEANFALARKSVDDFFTQVSENQLLNVPGLKSLRLDLLKSALGFYETFLTERGDDPALRVELAATHNRVGQVYRELGRASEGTRAFETAVDVYREALKRDPANRGLKEGLYKALSRLGKSDEAATLCEELLGADPTSRRYRIDLTNILNAQAIRRLNAGRADDALAAYRRCIELRLGLAAEDPDDPDIQMALFQSFNNLAVLLGSKGGEPAEALALYRRANAYAEAAGKRKSRDLSWGNAMSLGYNNAGATLSGMARYREAEAEFQKKLEVLRRQAVNNPEVPSAQAAYLAAARELATFQRMHSGPDIGAATLRQARGLVERMPREGPANLYNLACFHALSARYIENDGKTQLGETDRLERDELLAQASAELHQAVDEGWDQVERLRNDDDLSSLRGRDDFQVLVNRVEGMARAAALAKTEGDAAAKLKAGQQAAAIQKTLAEADPTDVRARSDLAATRKTIGMIQAGLGKTDEALATLEESREIYETLIRDRPRDPRLPALLNTTRAAIGQLHWKAGRLNEAIAIWKKVTTALDRAEKTAGLEPDILREYRSAYRLAALEYGRAGLWEESAGRLGRLLDSSGGVIPDADGNFTNGADLAGLTLILGKNEEFRHLCSRLRTAETTETEHSLWVIWPRLVAPDSGADASAMLKSARSIVKDDKDGWHRHVLCLAYFRSGDYEKAIAEAQAVEHHMNTDVVAMAHFKLGHTDEARRWLRKRARWVESRPDLAQADEGTYDLPGDDWREIFRDWLFIQVLAREAGMLIEGKPPAFLARSRLHRAELLVRLGEPARAETEFAAAVAENPGNPAVLLARGRTFLRLGRRAEAEADFARAEAIHSDDPAPWIGHARILAARHDRQDAAAAFAKAAAIAHDELNRFLETGWWVIGPYPDDMDLVFPPEHDPDPYRPVAPAGKGSPTAWKPIATGTLGRIDLRAVFNADHISAYAFNEVYSPDERTATLHISGSDALRVWFNGRLVHENKTPTNWELALDRIPVTLRRGRNTILAKVNQVDKEHQLIARLNDAPVDRAFDLATLMLWPEAAAMFKRAEEHCLTHNASLDSYYAAALRGADDLAGARRVVEDLIHRYGKISEGWAGSLLAWTGPFGPQVPAEYERIAEQAERNLIEKHHVSWLIPRTAWAYYRAGNPARTLELLTANPEDHGTYALLALAQHRLGQSNEARASLARADDYWRELLSAVNENDPLRRVYLPWEWSITSRIWYREAKILLEGADPGEDPRFVAYQARARAWLPRRDKATADYDLAVVLRPDEPKHWLARGRRLAELGRWDAAEADLAKAVALAPDDLQVVMERGRVLAEYGRPDKAAEDFARVLDRTPLDGLPFSAYGRLIRELPQYGQAFDHLRTLRPSNYELKLARGHVRAWQGQWAAALSEYSRNMTGTPPDHEEWNVYACLLLLNGNIPGYRACLKTLTVRDEGSAHHFASFVKARACGMSAASGVEPDRVVAWADHALTEKKYAWELHVLGLALHRAGRDSEAVARLEESLALKWSPPGDAQNRLVLAMAYQRLGDHAKALASLNEALAWWRTPEAGQYSGEAQVNLFDWLPLNILSREAEAVVLFDPIFPADPFAH